MYQIVHLIITIDSHMKLRRIGANQTVIMYNNGSEVFFSYDTPVAAKTENYNYFRTEDFYSKTTSRHINKYLGALNHSKVKQNIINCLANCAPDNLTSVECN